MGDWPGYDDSSVCVYLNYEVVLNAWSTAVEGDCP